MDNNLKNLSQADLKEIGDYIIGVIDNKEVGYSVRAKINANVYNLKKDVDSKATKEELANTTTNFKGYHSTIAALQVAYPQATSKKDFFAWVGSKPTIIWKINIDGGAWINTGDEPTEQEIDLAEYAKNGGSAITMQALDNATKAAQNLSFFSTTRILVGIRSFSNRRLWWLGKRGEMYAPGGLADELGGLVKDQLVRLSSFENKKWLWRFISPSGRILFGQKYNGFLIGKFEENEQIKQDIAALKKVIPSLTINLKGDSLTAGAGSGTYWFNQLQQRLNSLYGQTYMIINRGVGGESQSSIAARQGGVPALIKEDIILPADTTPITVTGMLTNKFGRPINVLKQRDSSLVNPCYLSGIECTLLWNGQDYKLSRNSNGLSLTIRANTPLYMHDAKDFRNNFFDFYWIGNNLDEETNEQRVQICKDMAAFGNNQNFVFVGLTTNKGWGDSTISMLVELENMMSDTFGLRFLNWRKYASSVDLLNDLGITPTEQDLTDIEIGRVPSSILADTIHFNDFGHRAFEKFIYAHLHQLGAFN